MKNKRSGNTIKSPLLHIAIISILVFIILSFLVSRPTAVTRLDILISKSVPNLYNPILNSIMLFITNIGGTIVLTVLTIILALFFLMKKKYKSFLFLAISMIIGFIVELTLKSLVHRIRPIDDIIEFTRFSFPSGHAEMSLIFFSILAITLIDYFKNKSVKTIFILISTALVLLIGFSRIYLNAHWLSDVIAGYLIGIAIVSICYMLIMKRK